VKAVVLFDVDGTLLITGGATTRCIWRAAEATVGRALDRCPLTAGLLDPELYFCIARHNRIERPEASLADYTQRYFQELESELEKTRDRVKVMPGVETILEELQNSPLAVTGILTGNFKCATELKLRFAGLGRFTFPVRAFGEDAPTRSELVAVALRRYCRSTGQCVTQVQTIIVGDTPRDIAAARSAGCKVLSVATGMYSLAQLRAENPDAAVENLLDIGPLRELIEQITCC
jgi:phosphoglycolate phosphatase-like HAD superfamily hydrolase